MGHNSYLTIRKKKMINPKKVTKYNRNKSQLQEWLLYCVMVAGKKSEIETRKLDTFLKGAKKLDMTPFEYIRYLLKASSVIFADGLMENLSRNKIAPYKQRHNSFVDAVSLLPDDLSKVNIDDLQEVRGISTKTSRFFLTHSREDFDEPVLDTHILRYLKDVGYDVPSSTPQNPKVYAKISNWFKRLANFEGKSVTDFDLEIWTKYSYGSA
jgi:thermostable 8-oxoguanine DNA glycosylase